MIWTATDLLKSFPRDRHRHSLQDFESVLRMWQWLERSNPLGKGVNSCAKWKPASRKKPHHPCTVQLFPSMLPTHPNMETVPIYIIRWLCGASPLIQEHCFPGTLSIYSDDCVPLKYKQLFLGGVGSYFKQQFVNTVRNIHLRTQYLCRSIHHQLIVVIEWRLTPSDLDPVKKLNRSQF